MYNIIASSAIFIYNKKGFLSLVFFQKHFLSQIQNIYICI